MSQIPPYGRRKGFAPRTPEQFGDGGAFPEILIPQYPLGMGTSSGSIADNSKTVALQTDGDGRTRYDAIAKQGKSADKLAVYTRPENMKEKWSRPDDLVRPDQSIDDVNTSRTQLALQAFLGKKVANAQKKIVKKAPEFVKYTPNPDAPGYNPDAKERVIKIVENQIDPLEPPKFKHRKVPGGQGTPPPPVHHSPPRKLTAADQAAWNIPPCVSNWKNNKGYIIPLDKRIAADGRNLQDVQLSDRHAEFAESMYIAEKKAREEVNIRQNFAKQKILQEHKETEERMKKEAKEAREAAQQLQSGRTRGGAPEEDDEEKKYRQEVLNDNRKDVERQFRLDRAGKRGTDRERDISEKVALGQQVQPSKQETLYDTRLMQQTAGVSAGFGNVDDQNDVYDKPLFADQQNNNFYKHDAERLEQGARALNNSNTEIDQSKGVSVQFMRDDKEEDEDDFGIDRLYKKAKHG